MGFSTLIRWLTEPAQDARHGALGDGDTEHFEFAMNPGGAPQPIGGSHLFYQSAEFHGGPSAASTAALRFWKDGRVFKLHSQMSRRRWPAEKIIVRSRCPRDSVRIIEATSVIVHCRSWQATNAFGRCPSRRSGQALAHEIGI